MNAKRTTQNKKAGKESFRTLKIRTIRYRDNQFIRLSLQEIENKKIISISRGYHNINDLDIIKSSVVISYKEIAEKVIQQIEELKTNLPRLQTVKKVKSKNNNKEDIKEIKL